MRLIKKSDNSSKPSLTIMLNVNGLNALTKKQRLSEQTTEQDTTINDC